MRLYRDLLADGELAYDPAQEQAAERLQALHDRLKGYRPAFRRGFTLFGGRGQDVTGLYICGAVGRGKSMLMDLFFRSAPVEAKRRVHFHAFMQEIHGAISEWRRLDERAKRARLRRLDLPQSVDDDPIVPAARAVAQDAVLLAFDEFQVNDVADAMILGRLFQALFDDGVVVVATSNTPPAELYRNGLNRQLFLPFIDLITERMAVFHLDSPVDYRLDRLRGMPVYFTPLGFAADKAMEAAWKTFTGEAGGTPCTIAVQGRMLRVPVMAKRMARFTFAELFEQPLGPADYLHIAEVFRVVFVDHVPRMGPERRNEALRFATFVDVIYEAKARLVMSADAMPTELFPQGDGHFEFARTVSRLIEMQAEDYGA